MSHPFIFCLHLGSYPRMYPCKWHVSHVYEVAKIRSSSPHISASCIFAEVQIYLPPAGATSPTVPWPFLCRENVMTVYYIIHYNDQMMKRLGFYLKLIMEDIWNESRESQVF